MRTRPKRKVIKPQKKGFFYPQSKFKKEQRVVTPRQETTNQNLRQDTNLLSSSDLITAVGTLLSAIIALFSALIAAFSIFVTFYNSEQANIRIDRTNALAATANTQSDKAISIAVESNKIASEANSISKQNTTPDFSVTYDVLTVTETRSLIESRVIPGEQMQVKTILITEYLLSQEQEEDEIRFVWMIIKNEGGLARGLFFSNPTWKERNQKYAPDKEWLIKDQIITDLNNQEAVAILVDHFTIKGIRSNNMSPSSTVYQRSLQDANFNYISIQLSWIDIYGKPGSEKVVLDSKMEIAPPIVTG